VIFSSRLLRPNPGPTNASANPSCLVIDHLSSLQPLVA
jgi:hypothetical protein